MSEETKYLIAVATPVDEPAHKTAGAWKSGLFNCFKYGACHKALLCACFFSSWLMGQLLTRMKMTWIGGSPSSASEAYKKTFRIVLVIAICNILIVSIFSCDPELSDGTDGDISMVSNEDCASWQNNLTNTVTSFFVLYTFIVMVRLRMAIRDKYSIPEENCVGCEDCCTVFFCGCCSAVQMAHQTADYENDKAFCLTTTGLSPFADSNEILTQAIVV